MASLESIRKRISTVKSTQKITRAMKMVAGARLNRAQVRIQEMRPYARYLTQLLAEVVQGDAEGGDSEAHALLQKRPEKRVLLLLVTSDRGLCGGFNATLVKATERFLRDKKEAGVTVELATVGRRGQDYFARRNASLHEYFEGVWDDLNLDQARRIARSILKPFAQGEVDAIYVLYNEFKSAMTQDITCARLLPLPAALPAAAGSDASGFDASGAEAAGPAPEYIFEPDKPLLLERLVPMYIETTLLRALYDSVASELGARMTAMDSATKNASEMIDGLTLKYNRQRQSVITTELIEIIAGSEALQG